MTNADLLVALNVALSQEGVWLAKVIEMLVEVENRRLHLELACSSMYLFCIRRLGLSEDQAYRRSAAAEIARKYPQALIALRERRIHLSGLIVLKEVLTAENVDDLLRRAAGKTKREIEALVASIAPRPDAKSSIRKYPDRRAPVLAPATLDTRTTQTPSAEQHLLQRVGVVDMGSSSNLAMCDAQTRANASIMHASQPVGASPRRPLLGDPNRQVEKGAMSSAAGSERGAACAPEAPGATGRQTEPARESVSTRLPLMGIPVGKQFAPLGTARHRVQFTASSALRKKLERAQSLMRHGNIDGDLAVVVERAVDLLITQLEKRKFAAKGKRSTAPKSELSRPTRASAGASSAKPMTPGVDDRPPCGDERRGKTDRASGCERGEASSLAAGRENREDGGGRALAGGGSEAPAPPAGHRAVPRAVLREVAARDEESCAFVASDGVRCGDRDWLEVDHRRPRAKGGTNEPANLRMYCRAHNHHAAEKAFGREHVRRAIEKRRSVQAARCNKEKQPSLAFDKPVR